METDKLDKILGFLKKVGAKHRAICWIEMFDDGSGQIMKSVAYDVDKWDEDIYGFTDLKELMEIIDNCND